MPAGAVGAAWAPSSWLSSAWEADAWGRSDAPAVTDPDVVQVTANIRSQVAASASIRQRVSGTARILSTVYLRVER